MANQRSKSKTPLSAWIEKSLKLKLDDMAEAEGIPLSEVVIRILTEQVARYPAHRDAYGIAAEGINSPHIAGKPGSPPPSQSTGPPKPSAPPASGSPTTYGKPRKRRKRKADGHS